MNPREMLKNALKKQTDLLNKVKAENRGFTVEEQKSFNDFQGEVENYRSLIEAEDALAASNSFINQPASKIDVPENVIVKPGQEVKVFNSLAENLASCKRAQNGQIDDKMQKVINATGASSGVGEDGGFLIEKQFTQQIMKSAVNEDPILSRVKKLPIGAGFNKAGWKDIDETSVATSVYGGVQAYWAAEAGTVSATKPKFVEREIQLSKLMGLAYGTDELDEDVVFYSALLQDAFVTAIRRESASAIISGTGIGKPLGITVSAGTVTAAKEAGQANGTVVWENIIKMYARSKNKAGSVWLVHPDVHQQLDLMSFAVGTGGVPVYLSASMSGSVPSMKGLPVIETDQCSALGTVGDIILADLNEYLWITKGDIKTDMSIHVKFEYAERAWRFVVRCNGAPMKNSPLTIKNSSNTRSSFVMLATR